MARNMKILFTYIKQSNEENTQIRKKKITTK